MNRFLVQLTTGEGTFGGFFNELAWISLPLSL
jgi:hypothetical protein